MNPSIAQFEALVDEARSEIPEVFLEACRDLAVRIEPHATDDVLAALDIAQPYDLLGLYHGINLARKSVLDLPRLPDEVILYRDPIIAYAHATGNSLADVVKHVLVHEIDHHLGFSDDDMMLIEETGPGIHPMRIDLVPTITEQMRLDQILEMKLFGLAHEETFTPKASSAGFRPSSVSSSN